MTVARMRYDSAADAFAVLRAGRRVRKRQVHNKVFAASKVYKLDVHGRTGAVFLIYCVFYNNTSTLGKLFTKSIRVVEEDETGDVCVFSDVYEVNETELEEVAERCTDAGLPVTAFVYDYPRLDFSQGHRPEKSIGILNTGYTQFYRGRIAGLRFSG